MSTHYSANGMMFSINGTALRVPDWRVPMIIEIDTTKGNGFNSFTLPLTNRVTNCAVECCDGQEKYITNYLDNTITFAQPGIYTLKIRGEAGWSFNNTGDCQKLITMTIRKYNTLEAIQKEANQQKRELFETPVSYSFRIFKDKQTEIIHIFYK